MTKKEAFQRQAGYGRKKNRYKWAADAQKWALSQKHKNAQANRFLVAQRSAQARSGTGWRRMASVRLPEGEWTLKFEDLKKFFIRKPKNALEGSDEAAAPQQSAQGAAIPAKLAEKCPHCGQIVLRRDGRKPQHLPQVRPL